MRIVLAYDMSAEAERALNVIAATTWPSASVIHMVTSATDVGTESEFAGPAESLRYSRRMRAAIDAGHEIARERLSKLGLEVASSIVAGSAASAVAAVATEVEADLLVVGALRHGVVGASLFGSVSAGIVSRSPCPVLVVRVELCERIILATDGSSASTEAVRVVSTWPLFAESRVRVVAVASDADDPFDDESSDAKARAAADSAAAVLADAGRRARVQVRTGDPVTEIEAATREWPADLVVVGSGGQSVVRQLLLGSVARALYHAVDSSILIAPPRKAE